MKSKLLLTVALAAILVGCDGGCGELPGNGVIAEESRDTGPFTGVIASLGLQTEVLVGPETSVTLRGDENLLGIMSLAVGDDGVLTAYWGASAPPVPTQPFVLTVTTPTLTLAGAEGGSRLLARGIQTDSFTVKACDSSEVLLIGSALGLSVETRSGGQVLAQELPVRISSVSLRDGARATLHVTQALTGSVVGGSSLTVQGHPPQVDVITSEDSQLLFE